jgi:hypothetical protein
MYILVKYFILKMRSFDCEWNNRKVPRLHDYPSGYPSISSLASSILGGEYQAWENARCGTSLTIPSDLHEIPMTI